MSAEGTFALLWGKILRSSIWMESKETRLVWITLLALKDKEGVVLGSVVGLAHTARVDPEECEVALEKFMSPDPDSGSKAEEGRRIRKVEGGWQIINHAQYQFSTEARRMKWAEQKRLQRIKEAAEAANEERPPKNKKRKLAIESAAERTAQKYEANGDQASADRCREIEDARVDIEDRERAEAECNELPPSL